VGLFSCIDAFSQHFALTKHLTARGKKLIQLWVTKILHKSETLINRFAIYILKNSDLKTKTKNNQFYLCIVKNYRPCCKKTKPKSEVVTSPESPQYYNFGGTHSAGDDDVVTPNSNYQSLQLHQLQSPDIYTQLADQ